MVAGQQMGIETALYSFLFDFSLPAYLIDAEERFKLVSRKYIVTNIQNGGSTVLLRRVILYNGKYLL